MRDARTRPVFLEQAIDDDHTFRPLPPPTGSWPYRLDLCHLMPSLDNDINTLRFHLVGDTGGLRDASQRAPLL